METIRGVRGRRHLALLIALGVGAAACGGSGPTHHNAHKHVASTTSSSTTSTSTPATSSSSSSSTSTSTPAHVAACSTGVLQVAAAGVATSAGTTHLRFSLTNGGPEACSLDGYPTVVAFGPSGAGGAGAGTRLSLGDIDLGGPPQAVTVASGASAHFLLSIAAVPVNGADCVSVASLQISPPASSESLSLPDSFQACGTDLGVYPVTGSGS